MKFIATMLIVTALFLFGCDDIIIPPTHLTVDDVSKEKVDLSWKDQSDNESGFEIERAIKGEKFRILHKTEANVKSFSDTQVVQGEIYAYRVRAFNDKTRSLYSNVVYADTNVNPETPPTAPQKLQSSDVTATSLVLTWVDASDNETGFEIHRALQPDFTDAHTIAADANEIRYQDDQLTPDTLYYYRMKAFNDIGDSEYTQSLEVKTAALPKLPPAAPSDLKASAISPTQISLSWQDNSDNEDGFTILASSDSVKFEEIHTSADNSTTFTHQDLSPQTVYYYKVFAFNTAGQSEETPVVEAETPPEPVIPPKSPADLGYADVTSNSARLAWTDMSDNEEGFNLEKSLSQDFSVVDTFAMDPNVTTYQDTNLLPSTDYYYRVLAFNQGGNSDYSNIVHFRTPDEVVELPAPSSLGLQEATPSALSISWQDNSDNEDGFIVERSTDGGQTFGELHKTTADQTTYTNSDLTPDTTYHYRVKAYKGDQTSDYSNTLEAKTTPQPPATPGAPSQLTAQSVLTDRITLTWQDNADNEDGFSLERSGNDTFTDAVAIDIDADLTTYTNTGLAPATTYYYRIRAYNQAGNSEFAQPVSATTQTDPSPDAQYVAGYTIAKESVLRRIPQWAINAAKENLNIMYCGTSHSSQTVEGMRGLMEYKSGDADLYNVTFNGSASNGALNMHYQPASVYPYAPDLGYDSTDGDGHTAYFRQTVSYLDSHPACNVVMWSWCRISGHDMDIYFNNFSELIAMYRAGGSKGRTEQNAVHFVFMTGYSLGEGDEPEPPYQKTTYQNYKRIVDYCKANKYFCLDYWSQDTYDYGDDSYNPQEYGNDNAQHLAWVNNHELGKDWFQCRSIYSGAVKLPEHANQHLTGNRRAYAAWWIFARLAGWDGTLE